MIRKIWVMICVEETQGDVRKWGKRKSRGNMGDGKGNYMMGRVRAREWYMDV